MNILIPTADYPPIEGGIATVALNVSRELAAQGHDVTVVAPRFADMQEFDRNEPVHVIRYPGYRTGWLRFIPMAIACLPHLRSADLILGINIAYGGLIGLVANRLFGTPYVTFAYAYEFLKFSPRSIFARLLRSAYNCSACVVAISRYTQENLERFGVPSDRIERILPGSPALRPISGDAVARLKDRLALNGHKIILAVGRMIPRKNHTTLVRALPIILERHPHTVLICAGQGPCLSEVSRAAREFGVRDHIRLPGRLADDEVATLYACCNVFALPTGSNTGGQVEGFGLVFAEAAAYSKPVVAGRSGGVSDAVVDGETGFIVDPGDPAEVAEVITRLITDDELANRLGSRGRQRVVDELNWTTFTTRLLQAFEDRR